MRKKTTSDYIKAFALLTTILLSTMSILVSTTMESPGQLIADNPAISVQGTEDFDFGAWGGWWVRGGSTGVEFTFTGIDTAAIPGTHVLVNFNLGVGNHMNAETGLDGLVDITINPGIAGWTYAIANVLFDNLDHSNHVYYMGQGGTYETKASILVNKDYIRGGTLIIKLHRRPDIKDYSPSAPTCTNQPIDMSTSPPMVPTGCYDYDDAHTVHIGVRTTDATGTVAVNGEVTIWVMTAEQVIADNPGVSVQGTEDFNFPGWGGWWVRGGSTGVEFTFTGIITAAIAGTHVEVMFNLGVSNHMNGDFGLDGLVDITINPGVAGWTYTIANVLFDNLDPANHLAAWGEQTYESYDTTAAICVNKEYIRGGTLIIKVHRHTDIKDYSPHVTTCTNAPIDMSTSPPTVPTGCYDYDDAHTVHIGVRTTDATGTVAANGEVTIYSKEIVPPSDGPRGPGLDIYFYSDVYAAYAALSACEIDLVAFTEWSVGLPLHDGNQLGSDIYWDAVANPNIQVAPFAGNDMVAFDFNNNYTIPAYPGIRSPMTYLSFRQALACLVDKDYIVDVIKGGFAERIDVPVPATQRDWWNESVVGANYPYPFDPWAAVAFLDADGFTEGPTPNPYFDPMVPWSSEFIRVYPPDHSMAGLDLDPIVFCVRTDDLARLAAGRLLYEYMRLLGIPVNPVEGPKEILYPMVMGDRNCHIYTSGWVVKKYPIYLYKLYHNDFWYPFGANYVTGIDEAGNSNYPDLDDSLEQTWYNETYGGSMAACRRAQGIMVDNCISVWLYSSRGFCVYKNLLGVVNMDGYGLVNKYTFMNAYRADDPDAPIRIGLINAPISLNVLYSNWIYDWICLDRIYSHLLNEAPYDITVDQPWVAQDWHVCTWIDPQDGLEKTKVTYWLRKDVFWVQPVTGVIDYQLTAHDVEFSIWFIYAYADSWPWNVVKDVHHTRIIDDFCIEVYFNSRSYWAYYWIGKQLPLIPKQLWLQNFCEIRQASIILDRPYEPCEKLMFTEDPVVQVVEATLDGEPLVEGEDYQIVARWIPFEHPDLTGVDILYDLYHGERDTGELSILLSDAVGRGATVSYNSVPITPSILADYEILLINEWDTVTWSTSELDAVRAWVSNGGGVLFHGDEIGPAMAVASIFGISYGPGSGVAGPTTNIVPHYVTQGVTTVNVPDPLRVLITVSPAYPIVYDQGMNEMVAVSYYGEGKIVFFGDDMLRDGEINTGDNRIIANRAINHLACYPLAEQQIRCHNWIHWLRPALPGQELTVWYWTPHNAPSPRGFFPGDYPWQEKLEGCGMYYIVDFVPGIGGYMILRANQYYFFMETPILGEIDWRWKWGPRDPTRPAPQCPEGPRTGCFKIDIYDVVRACAAYGSRGDGALDPYWFPGVDLARPECIINIYDVVTICGSYGEEFGHPPLDP